MPVKPPAAARQDRFLDADGKPCPSRSPSTTAWPWPRRDCCGLELAHKEHGKLPWADLFAPAIRLAEQGFPVSPRLHALLSGNKALPKQPAAAAYFYAPDGQPWPVGHVKNPEEPEFAQTLREIAARGADASTVARSRAISSRPCTVTPSPAI